MQENIKPVRRFWDRVYKTSVAQIREYIDIQQYIDKHIRCVRLQTCVCKHPQCH